MGLGAPGQVSEKIWAVEICSHKVGRGGERTFWPLDLPETYLGSPKVFQTNKIAD